MIACTKREARNRLNLGANRGNNSQQDLTDSIQNEPTSLPTIAENDLGNVRAGCDRTVILLPDPDVIAKMG